MGGVSSHCQPPAGQPQPASQPGWGPRGSEREEDPRLGARPDQAKAGVPFTMQRVSPKRTALQRV